MPGKLRGTWYTATGRNSAVNLVNLVGQDSTKTVYRRFPVYFSLCTYSEGGHPSKYV